MPHICRTYGLPVARAAIAEGIQCAWTRSASRAARRAATANAPRKGGTSASFGYDGVGRITVEAIRLRISGTRPDGCRASKCSFLAMEINYGPFESVLELPPGYDLSQAKAAYLNGFLRIDVPLVQRSSKPTTVPIAEGNSLL